MTTGVRRAAVAGAFYAGAPAELRAQIEAAFRHPVGPGRLPEVDPAGPRQVVGLVAPHAGYVYSGPVAAHAYAALAADGRPEVAVILGPSHYGLGTVVSVSPADGWETPLGMVAVDRALADAIATALPWPAVSAAAHELEHSIEVQLPFLQYLYGDGLRIVPIAMTEQSLAVASTLGLALGRALAGRNAVVIASTDLTHYEPQSSAIQKDDLALAAMVDFSAARLFEIAPRYASVCGPGPVAAALLACRELGAKHAAVLQHATSGDVAGDKRRVVGYAALAISRERVPAD